MGIIFKKNVGFEWQTSNGTSVLLRYEFPNPSFEVPPGDNIIFELWADQHAESQIYPVTFDAGVTCGWLLTVSALESDEIPEEYRLDKNFRIAAWAIVRFLIEKYKSSLEEISLKENRYEFDLTDCIDNELSILALHRPRTPSKISDKPMVLIPKLMSIGLIPYSCENSKKILRPAFQNDAEVLNISTNIPEHDFQDFYNDLLSRYIPSVDDLAFKFYLFYQIIETMMEDVLVDSAKGVLADLTLAQGNVVAIRDSLDKYQKISTESSRIKKIFTVLSPSQCNGLREACIFFLESVDPEFNRVNHSEETVAFFCIRSGINLFIITGARRWEIPNCCKYLLN
jgi:hypothetical protein